MSENSLLHYDLTHEIIGAFYEVYSVLGCGLMESIYAGALTHELRIRGLGVQREVPFEVAYKGTVVGRHRLDMIVDRAVVVETKSTALLPLYFRRQLVSYLKASGIEVGLLLHFGPSARFYRVVRTSPEVA